MTLDIYIKWKDKSYKGMRMIQLPILPESFEVTAMQNDTSVYVHNFGELNLKGKRSLYTITFSSFFPKEYYSFSKDDIEDPYFYISQLKKLFKENKTVRLVLTDTSINMQCTISEFIYGEYGRNGDVSYTLSFKEYREPKRKKYKKKKKDKSAKGKVNKKKKPVSYKWKKGDTWQKVQKKKTGSSQGWKTTKKKNKKVINKAKKKHPKKKEKNALIGYKVLIYWYS